MLIIRRAGQLSTVQDAGRWGYQALGVTPGGAMDDVALCVGNWIVGNEETAPAIEMTWTGAHIGFLQDTLITLTGAEAEAHCNGLPVPAWRPVWVKQGSLLCIDRLTFGARAYLCVQGGIDIKRVLEGRGTHLRAGFGGHEGRALLQNDILSLTPQQPLYPALYKALFEAQKDFVAADWQVSVRRDWNPKSAAPLWLLAGKQQVELGTWGMQRLHDEAFTVLPQSDRQALRLTGPLLSVDQDRQISAGVCFGVVQLPPDGHPIVLLADYQTTGGYPVVGVVASVERSRLAQYRPNDKLRFRPCTLDEAHQALLARETRLQALKTQLKWRCRDV